MKKVRESNLELYRIVLMILIIAHHYVVNSGLLQAAMSDGANMKSVGLLALGAWGKIGINCFLLITGYYMCTSKITLKKFLKLFLEIEFYNVVIYIIFLAAGYERLSVGSVLITVFPFIEVSKNFTGCYMLFYLLIPFLNILIGQLDKKKFLVLLLVLLGIYTVIGSIPKTNVMFNYVTWFSIVYLVGAFIRKYVSLEKIKQRKLVMANLILVVLCVASVPVCWKLLGVPYFFVNDSNKILALAMSVGLFLSFKKLKIKNSKFINQVAATTFGVLLIHANSNAMRSWLWGGVFKNTEWYDTPWLFVHMIITIVVVYVACALIDVVRIKIFERTVDVWIDRIDRKMESRKRWTPKSLGTKQKI